MKVVYSVPYGEQVHRVLWKRAGGDVDRFVEVLETYVYNKLRGRYKCLVDVDEVWNRSGVEAQLKFEVVPGILFPAEGGEKVPRAIPVTLQLEREQKRKGVVERKLIREEKEEGGEESSWRETVQVLLDIVSSSTDVIGDSVRDYFEVDDEEIRDAIRSKIVSALELLQIAVDELSSRFGFVPEIGELISGEEDGEEEEEEGEAVGKGNDGRGSEEGDDFVDDTLEQGESENREQDIG